METVGIIATVLFAVLVLLVAYVLLRSLPDIARYRRLRRM